MTKHINLAWLALAVMAAGTAAAQTTLGPVEFLPTSGSGSWFWIDNPGASGNYLRISNGTAPGGAGTVVVTASGAVGIGTTSPAALLQVAGNLMVGNVAPNCDSPSGLLFNGGISSVLLDCTQNVYLLSGFTINTNGQNVAQTASPVGLFTQNDGFHFMADTGKTTGATYTPTERLTISSSSGNVGIGTTNPTHTLSVNGTIQAKEVLVNTGWSDYVFDPNYRVRPLTEVAAFIKANHHLPDIPSEAEVKENGVSLGDMQSKLLAKVEELTL